MGKPYQRVLLKLSGEALMGDLPYGIDPTVVQNIAQEIASERKYKNDIVQQMS